MKISGPYISIEKKTLLSPDLEVLLRISRERDVLPLEGAPRRPTGIPIVSWTLSSKASIPVLIVFCSM